MLSASLNKTFPSFYFGHISYHKVEYDLKNILLTTATAYLVLYVVVVVWFSFFLFLSSSSSFFKFYLLLLVFLLFPISNNGSFTCTIPQTG